LADSLKRSGVREPVIVTQDPSQPGRYRIVAGERRWRAAQLAELQEIPCIIDERLAETKHRLLAQAEENLHRENLNAIEEAAVLVQLMEAFGVDAEAAGALIGRSYQQARRLVQIHNAPEPIKDAVIRGLIDGRAGLELVRNHNKLARTPGPNGSKRALAEAEELIDRVVKERWTIRRLENHARRLLGGEAGERGSATR
jgi:ParB family transcriptional regulator, chromosome partitioning protein